MRTVKFPRFFTVCFALVFTLYAHYSTIWKDDDGTFIGTCMRCYHGYLLTVYTYSTVEQCTLQYFCVATSLINPLLCWYTFFT